MFANWIECSSSTGGTGDITLASVTWGATFASAFGSSGTRKVAYVIEQFSDGLRVGPPAKAEHGIADIALSTLVLSRSTAKILSTWDGSSYAVSGSRISLSTNGNLVRVICAPTADFGPSILPYYGYGLGGDNLGIPSAHGVLANSVMNLTANRETYVPLLWRGCGAIIEAGIAVTTALASSNVKCAIYELADTGGPGVRLLDINSGSPFSGATTGLKTASLSGFWLPPGWYYAGLIGDSALELRAFDPRVGPTPAGTASSGISGSYLYATGSYATGLPSPASTTLTTASNSAAPMLFLKATN